MQTRKIVAAATALLWSGTCSFAIDVGAGGAGVSAGSDGVSAGVDGVGSVGIGAGSDGSVSAEASVGGTSEGIGAGGSSGSGGSRGSSGTSGAASSSASNGSSNSAGSASSGPSSASSNAGSAASAPASRSATAARDTGGRISLPAELRPRGLIWRLEGSAPVPTIAGTASTTVNACRDAVAQAARAYGMVDVTAVSYGQTVQLSDGGHVAPVFMRIVYERQGGREMRQAPILCEVDQAGAVSALSEATG